MVRTRDAHPLEGDRLDDPMFWISMWRSEGVDVDERVEQALLWLQEVALLPCPLPHWPQDSCLRIGLEMADIICDISQDLDTLLASLVYRAVREERITIDHVEYRLGKTVRRLVEGTLKMRAVSDGALDNVKAIGGKQAGLDVVRRMLVSLVDDPRVAIIKLAERTAVIRAIKPHPDEDRQRVARGIFDIYAPLAHRLGIGQIRWELEDLAFRYLHASEYKTIAQQLAEKRQEREHYISDLVSDLKAQLETVGLNPDISWRAKHIFSIWRKMQRKNIDFAEVFDVRAVRLLVQEPRDCYAALGMVHAAYKPVPGEFDDYIAQPKPNGYRSLHTAVIGPAGKVVEIQIRTYAMHEEAEYGVCAHYRYKGHDQETQSGYDQKIEFFRQVLAWHDEENDDLLETFKNEAADDRVYVFTPNGDIVDLPQGSTPLDFAYKVHTEVGHRCRGAKVNGRIVPLTYRLEIGDKLEILTTKEGKPSRDWLIPSLGFIATSRARTKIQTWFRAQDREENLAEGRQLLETELKRLALVPVDMERLVQEMGLQTAEELWVGLGAGDFRLSQAINAVYRIANPEPELEALPLSKAQTGQRGSVTISGVGNLAHQLAKCCKPVAGDSVRGFITRGRGVTVHRVDCPDLMALYEAEPQRVVDVEWGDSDKSYPVDLIISAYDRSGLLRDVSGVLNTEHCNVLAMNTVSQVSEGVANMTLRIEVDSLDRLRGVLSRLNRLPSIIEARRDRG